MEKKMSYTIDAENRSLGRLASEIAVALQGKGSPSYNPRLPSGVRVMVKNIDKVKIAGKKGVQKVYYRHTGYMGHLKERTLKEAFRRSPEAVLRKTVANMLPRNRLRAVRMRQLRFDRS